MANFAIITRVKVDAPIWLERNIPEHHRLQVLDLESLAHHPQVELHLGALESGYRSVQQALGSTGVWKGGGE